MFAVIKTGGKQYRVAAQDKITVMTIAGDPGECGGRGSYPSGAVRSEHPRIPLHFTHRNSVNTGSFPAPPPVASSGRCPDGLWTMPEKQTSSSALPRGIRFGAWSWSVPVSCWPLNGMQQGPGQPNIARRALNVRIDNAPAARPHTGKEPARPKPVARKPAAKHPGSGRGHPVRVIRRVVRPKPPRRMVTVPRVSVTGSPRPAPPPLRPRPAEPLR